MLRLEQTIPWGPIADKHKRYIGNALSCRMAVAEGAIRSAKTISNCIIAAMYLETCPDRFHLASGSTIGNAKLNIGVCNGFGLEALFRGRCKWGKFKDNEALYLYTQTGEKIILFAGGGKSDSFRRILGNSYGLWIATEINEHYDSEDSGQSFIKVAFGRQLAAKHPFTLWDLNPCYPEHTIYTSYIDRYRESPLAGGYLYEHFTLKDNATITPERMREIESQYTPGTVWYRRDILGERCVAEGLVFPAFASDAKPYIVDDAGAFDKVVIGVDFGGNGSMTAMCALGYHGYSSFTVIDEYSLPITQEIDANAICAAYVSFARRVNERFGRVDWTFGDSASPTMINSLVSAARAVGVDSRHITGCRKNKVSQRPITIDRLLNTGRLKFLRGCTETVHALQSLRWDKKRPDEPEDKNAGGNINDTYDAFCYTWLDFVEYIDRK